jgi:electron transfer flavoprotein beta subunit
VRIVVCVKYVPDAQAQRRFVESDHTVDRAGVDGLLSELDEYAVEEALKLRERTDAAADSSVTVLSVGPGQAADALRKALQMGADAAVHVLDDGLHGSDAPATAKVLAAAIGKLQYDLVLTGMASTDAGMSVVPAMVAEYLGLPQVTFANELTIEDADAGRGSVVRIVRDGEVNAEVIEATLPALVSVTDQINDPRYPSFKGIMAAKKKPTQTWTLADLGIDQAEVGLAGAWTAVSTVLARPARQAGQKVADEGDGGVKLVEYLAGAKLV